MSVRLSLSPVRTALDKVYNQFRSFERYSEDYDLYYNTVPTQWNYTQERPYKKDTLISTKRVYLHYYFSLDKAAEDEKAFDRQLVELRQELLSGNRLPKHERLHQKYFEVTSTPKRGVKVRVKQEVIECFHAVGHEPCVGEVLEKQKMIDANLGFDPLSSL